MPEPFYAVGLWYEDFEQTSDAVVCALLAQAAYRPAALEHAVERDEAPETSAAGLG
jgi:predicted phosphoribosyltransferase